MLMKQMLEVFEILDDENAGGQRMKEYFQTVNPEARVETFVLRGDEGSTDAIRILIPGSHGKMSGGTAPTLGIIGRLGGLGARPVMKGFVSDGDGALAALTAAAKLLDMQKKGDILEGDVIVATHICPDAPTQPHEPVPFMGSPIEMDQNNEAEVMPEMDAILSIDTTKGNRVINHRGQPQSSLRCLVDMKECVNIWDVNLIVENDSLMIEALVKTSTDVGEVASRRVVEYLRGGEGTDTMSNTVENQIAKAI